MRSFIKNAMKKRIVIMMIVAIALSNLVVPVNNKTAYAKGVYQYDCKFKRKLDLNTDRSDPVFAPFLSRGVQELSGIKGDSFKNKSAYDDSLYLWYTVKKVGKIYRITIEQDTISKRKTAKFVLKSRKKKYKITYIIKLDHYDNEGNIIRSDGSFEKKGSWLNDNNADYELHPTAEPTAKPAVTSTPEPTANPSGNMTPTQIRDELKARYGVDASITKLSGADVFSYNFAKPKNSAEQKAFDAIVNEIKALCVDPDATLKNRSWIKTPKSGIKDRCGQLVQENDTDLRTLPLLTPGWMSEQRKREIIINLYFLDRTVYDPEYSKGEYEDEDKPYQRILDGTYQGVCGRGAMRAFRIIYATNLGIIPHVVSDYDANHTWLVVESTDRSGTQFMRGMWITANTFDMKFDIDLYKNRGWYQSYNHSGADILKEEYRYLDQNVVMTFADLGKSWSTYANDFYGIRFWYYWSGLIDILAVNDMLNL